MDSLRQPFPASTSSEQAWVTSPPLLLESAGPPVSFLSHPAHLQAAQAPSDLTRHCSVTPGKGNRHILLQKPTPPVLFSPVIFV